MSDSQSHGDLLMMFVGPSGNIDGESLTRFNDAEGNPTPDRLTRDFRKGKFFQIKTFELEFEVNDSTGSGGSGGSGGTTKKGAPVVQVHVHPTTGGSGAGGGGSGGGGGGSSQPFSGWLSTGMNSTLKLQVNACKVTRFVDIASPKLFQLATGTKTFKQAVIVARRSGGMLSGPVGFFRLEFGDRSDPTKGVVINNLSWEYDDGMVTEQLSFYYRKLMVYYVPQTMAGQASVESTGSWEWSAQTQN